MNNNKTKVITIAALVIAIIALSIGFAAFSSTLNIQTGASVTPNDTFVVKFSKENGSLVEDQPVTASNGSQYGGNATINNTDVKNPKIDNLSASFTAPGQSVTYTFYVRNMGDFDAYLTAVRFNNAEGKQVFQSCTSSGTNPGTQTIVDDVCNDITFTLELEDTPNKVLTSESNFAQVVGNDYKVLKSTTPGSGTTNSKMVKVTIAYPNKDGVHYADGSFTVNFGSVEMIFATLAGYVPTTPQPTIVASDYIVIQDEETEEWTISGYFGSATSLTIPSQLPYTNFTLDSFDVALCMEQNEAEESECLEEKDDLINGTGKSTLGDVYLYPEDFPYAVASITQSSTLVTPTVIGSGAFESKGLTSVTIPDTITKIRRDAFFKNDLTNVILGSGLTYIGDSAFHENSLTVVTINANQANVDISANAFDSGTTIKFNDATVTW